MIAIKHGIGQENYSIEVSWLVFLIDCHSTYKRDLLAINPLIRLFIVFSRYPSNSSPSSPSFSLHDYLGKSVPQPLCRRSQRSHSRPLSSKEGDMGHSGIRVCCSGCHLGMPESSLTKQRRKIEGPQY